MKRISAFMLILLLSFPLPPTQVESENAYTYMYERSGESTNSFQDQTEYSHGIFKYMVDNDGYIWITDMDESAREEKYDTIAVPSVIDGREVKRIQQVFPHTDVSKIEFEEGIEYIEAGVVDHSTVEKIIFPKSCKYMSDEGLLETPVIHDCDSLETIEFLGGDLKWAGLIAAGCRNLKKIIFHEDLDNIRQELYKSFCNFKSRTKGVEPWYADGINENIKMKASRGTNLEKYAYENAITFEALDGSGENVSQWAKSELMSAYALGFVPLSLRENCTKAITRGEFAHMALYFLSVQYGYQPEYIIKTAADEGKSYPIDNFTAAYCAAKKDRAGNDFVADSKKWEYESKDSYDATVLFSDTPFEDVKDDDNGKFIGLAYNIGLVNGVSGESFKPDGLITRQEAAAMMMRVYNTYAHYERTEVAEPFADDEEISDWARENVYDAKALGIMQGTGGNNFEPSGNCSVEQAIASFLRLYESAPVSRKLRNIEPLVSYEYEKDQLCEDNSHFAVELEEEHDDYKIIQGVYYTDGGSDRRLYVLYKYGGIRDLTAYVPQSGKNDAEIADIGKYNDQRKEGQGEETVTFTAYIGDTFHMYNTLYCGNWHNAGRYRFEVDLKTGNVTGLWDVQWECSPHYPGNNMPPEYWNCDIMSY